MSGVIKVPISQALGGSDGASKIGFSAAGGVQRTMQDKARESVSVRDFGAVGDGVTNDSAAIQAAVNSSAKSIELVAGDTYLINTTITFPSGKRLFGAAKLKLGSAGQRVIRTASNAKGCVFEGFEIEGFSGGGSYVGGEFGIQLDEADNCVIRGVTAHDLGGDGFYVGPNSANNNLIENCVGYNNGRQGVTIAGGAYNVVRGGYYYDNLLYGVDLEGPTVADSLVDGVVAWGNMNGVTSDGGTVGKAIITNCRCYGNDDHGIQASGEYDRAANNTCFNNGKAGVFGGSDFSTMSGNQCFGNGWDGVRCDPAETKTGMVVSGNVCHDNGRNGISLGRISSSAVSANTCFDNDSADTTTYAGIAISAGSANSVTGNNCGNRTAAGQRWGVFLGADSSINSVTGNVFSNNKTAPTRDDGTSNVFTNNLGA